MAKINTDGIILDIDGTIWNTTGVIAGAWNSAIEKSGLSAKKVFPEILKKEFGKPMDIIALDLWPNLSEGEREILMAACCECEQIALKENTKDITYSGVVETIKKMSAEFDFYIVSNCQSGYIELTLQKNGIEEFIKDSECYGDTKKYKAENLKLIVERNSIKNPAYVGDTQGDADACKEAGVPFIWAAYGFGDVKEWQAKIEKFSELQNLLCAAARS